MKKIIKVLFVLTILFTSFSVFAVDVSLTIRDGNTFVFQTANVPIQPGDTVLTVLNNADQADSSWNISDLQHYSFGDYIKCITSPAGNHCDNWQYTVNGFYPLASVDQNIVSANDFIYLYFGPQNRVNLSSNNIKTTDILTVTAEKYNYQNNAWVIKIGVTLGLTQPNLDPNSWTPIEVQTNAVDGNGQAIFSSIPAGSYNVGIQPDYFPTEVLTVTTPPIPAGGGIIFNPPTPVKAKFDLQKALEFLISQQKENGSFGEDLYTDWTAVALTEATDFQSQKEKLIQYLKELKTNNYQLTDYERHAMALMAAGLNPYDINGENYIKKIIDSFDGKQFGDKDKDNDDIFALIVLQNLEFTKEEKMIKDDVTFILNNQKKDGSWDESIDMTGAGMEALSFLNADEQVKNALTKAKEFLKQNQKNDGGFGNVSSTAWAIEGILALSEKPENWIKNDNSPLDYLGINQDIDGGTKNDDKKSKIWETAYVVSALSGKTWNQIMQKFEKPKPVNPISEEIIIPKKIEEKLPEKIIAKNTAKKTVRIVKISKPKKEIQKTEELSFQNTATVINAVTDSSAQKIEPTKKSWFRILLDKIFSIF